MNSSVSDNNNDASCPVCKSSRYLNPSLKLLVSPCYHKMCTTCIDRLFTAGPSPCPICRQTLRKANFVTQTFEDLVVEKEIQIRKKVGKYFNKRIEDFNGDLRAFNNYLEEAEEILFNLINDVDVQQTNDRIEKFRQENKEVIAANLAKQMNEEKAISYRIEKEKRDKMLRKEAYLSQIQEMDKLKRMEQEDIIRQLETSDKSAQEIFLNTRANRQAALDAFNHEVLEGGAGGGAGLLSVDDDDYYNDHFAGGDGGDEDYFQLRDPSHSINPASDALLLMDMPVPFVLNPDNYNDPWTAGYKNDPKQRAGGYMPAFTFERALASAFTGLFSNLDTPH